MGATFSRNLARNIKRMLDDPTKGRRFVHEHLSEALESKQLRPEEFSIRDLAEETVENGREWVRAMDPRQSGGGLNLLEAGNAVSTTDFSNITGQIVINRVLDASMGDDYAMTRIIPTIPTRLSGEKMPGISGLGDVAQEVGEGKNFPHAGVSEDFIETPQTTKRGFIVPVTKEAIFFDLTGQVLARCSAVGEALGLNKEKRLIDCVIDETVTTHRYRRLGLGAIQTYGDNSGTHDFDNLQASNGLVDYTNIAAAELLLSSMLDPNTGEPMAMYADTLIVTPQNTPTAWKIQNAMLVATQAGGFATSGNLLRTDAPNPLGKTPFSPTFNIVSSRLLAARMALGSAEPLTSWYYGSPSRAFAYMENWPITVVQAPDNSEAEFTQDVVLRFKASERGAAATIEPRYMVKSTA